MANLAVSRAKYANLVSAVQNHTRLVEAARKNLADARARQAGAHSASVISRIDGVETGVRPAGPARRTVAAAGGLGGLLLGFGLVLLFANPAPPAAKPSSPGEHGTLSPRDEAADSFDAQTVERPRGFTGAFGMCRDVSLNEAVRTVENHF
jgi:hypothetical protein